MSLNSLQVPLWVCSVHAEETGELLFFLLEADIFHFRLHLLNAFIADLNDPSGGHTNILVSYLQKQPSELHSVKEYQV